MSNMTITPQPSFYGDYEKGEEPTDWLRKYELSFPPSATEADKLSRFELQCAAASPAETWHANLPASDKATWSAFRAAFKVRWPQPAQVTLTAAQKKERLKAVVLKEEEIGVMIEEDRGREWGHVKWAKKVARMAQGFNDSQCHLLDVVLENTPEVLRDFMLDNYTTWTDFEADVMKISASQLLRAKQRLATERKLREDVDKLQSKTVNDRKISQSPSQTNPISYSAPPPYRYGHRYNGPPASVSQHQATAIPPAFQPSVQSPTPQIPQTRQSTNMFTPGMPMSRGNLFYGHRGYPQTPTRRGGSPADHMRTAAQYATIPHHPNSDAGKQAYAQQVQEWRTQHRVDAIPNSQRPFPLKPGTSPIGSRECFNCGMATAPPHQAYECPNEPVPIQETKWRETVSRLVSRTLATPTTPGQMSNVQFVSNTAAVPYAPQMAQVPFPPYSYFAETYEPYNVTGNEYGPQM
ncbi:hypothetical protein C8R48DRAFT_675684 [Suillus tomentosus]|nr:hypothetical protein C8R48DRAFT_675684 [Suillus tomentosus]